MYLLSLYLQFLEQATGIFSNYERFCELDERLSCSTTYVNYTTEKKIMNITVFWNMTSCSLDVKK
jgi:hypothetical protein